MIINHMKRGLIMGKKIFYAVAGLLVIIYFMPNSKKKAAVAQKPISIGTPSKSLSSPDGNTVHIGNEKQGIDLDEYYRVHWH